MKPYPNYKPSGVPWIGDVPAHWAVEKVKFLARLRGQKSVGASVGVRYVGMEHVLPRVGKFAPAIAGTQEEAESTVNVFFKEDVLFGKLRPYLAKCVVADSDGVCSSEFLVLRSSDSVYPAYLSAAMLMQGFIDTVDASTYGAKMPRAAWEFISQQKLPFPPKDEQQAIADYLDIETARIDELMREKDELIGLLREAQSSAFSSAIAKFSRLGIGSKSSRFPWLDSFPLAWRTARVKHVTQSVDQGISPQCESYPPDDGQWGVLKVGCVNSGDFNPLESKALPNDIAPIESITLKKGDVLISRANTKNLVGRAAMVNRDYPRLMLSDKHYRLRLDLRECEPQFLVFVLTHPAVRVFIEERATGASASMLNIDQRTIMDLEFPLPPLDIQQQIIRESQADRDALAKLMAHTNDEIALLKELRAASIADAVLGRIDVRTTKYRESQWPQDQERFKFISQMVTPEAFGSQS
ncbi:restriction endonuclease subunit S [Burkholderia cenocepacia]|uniref:restriction endonuclease subunit S n=1 Tax=Burkholderia cenocepacia TaxID=95486 RepID=UPI001BA4E713|nr:restriction endonuclease subunit S [Burkholderia cenocepacia]QUN54582.1 restriction endonuclease subunit S [Burkholderia cenocepacia]